MTRIYLAARYTRREELLTYKADLERHGYEVGARWLAGDHQWDPDGAIATEAERVWEATGSYPDNAVGFAVDDLEDVLAASVVISFTETPRGAVIDEPRLRDAVREVCDRAIHGYEIHELDYPYLADALNVRAARLSRGGRHVEFGLALGLGKRTIVVGPRENVFHLLPQVIQFDTWAEVIPSLQLAPVASHG